MTIRAKVNNPTLAESIANIETQIAYYRSKNETKTVKILKKILDRLLAEKNKTKTSSFENL